MRAPAGARAGAGLLLVVSAVFAEALFTGRVFFQRDIHAYWLPKSEVIRSLLRDGAGLGWDPYAAFGTPLFADPSNQLAYPPTWIGLALPASLHFKLFVLLHAWAAGLGAFFLARRLGGSGPAGILAGAVYACSGPFLSAVGMYHHFAGAAWTPWVLLALVAALERPAPARGLALGAVAAGQALAGSADLCVMTALLALALFGEWLWRRDRPSPAWAAFRAIAIAVGFAGALAAVQWLPTLALVAGTPRQGLNPETNMYWSLHPASLVDLLVPRLVADLSLKPAARALIFESREPLLASIYLGVPAAVLVALGLTDPRARLRGVLGLAFLFFLLAALGRHAPVYPLLLKLPVFGLFRYPPKYLLPAALLWGLLVARGVDAWRRPWSALEARRASRVAIAALALGVAALAAAAMCGKGTGPLAGLVDRSAGGTAEEPLRPAAGRLALASATLFLSAGCVLARVRAQIPGLAWGGALLVIADLVLAGRLVNPLAPPDLIRHRPAVLSALGPDADRERIFSHPHPLPWLNQRFAGPPGGWDAQAAWSLQSVDRLEPLTGARFGLRGSYDGDFTGLGLADIYPMGAIMLQFEKTPLGPRLLRMGNVGHVVALEPDAFGLPEVGAFPSVLSTPVRLFRVEDALPPVYVVDGVRVADGRRAWETLAGAFDPAREVILAGGLAPRPATADFRGSARLVSRRADVVVADAELSGPGVLVLIEAWGRGWGVRIDGRPAPLLRANGLFRAAALGAGRHRVAFAYETPLLKAGIGVAGAAAILGLVVAGRGLHRRPKGDEV